MRREFGLLILMSVVLGLFPSGFLTGCRQNQLERESITRIPNNPPVPGTLVVVARLAEAPGNFPDNDHYDYAYILKYRLEFVYRGDYQDEFLLVGHYNPRIPRKALRGAITEKAGGNVIDYQVGDLHYLVLNPLQQVYEDAVEDEFYLENRPRFWASWADLYIPPADNGTTVLPATSDSQP